MTFLGAMVELLDIVEVVDMGMTEVQADVEVAMEI